LLESNFVQECVAKMHQKWIVFTERIGDARDNVVEHGDQRGLQRIFQSFGFDVLYNNRLRSVCYSMLKTLFVKRIPKIL